jgi:glycerol-3-phosphate dehydrogenase
VCVIGGGATGAGCALDAQVRGLRTLLVDAGDFGAATSSASTKLVHGGVRYLEQAAKELDLGQLKVVRTALRERKGMLQRAPHLAQPAEFLIPCYRAFDLLYYRAGVAFYDWLADAAGVGRSYHMNPAETLQQWSDLAAGGLKGGVVYSDGQFDDARFCLALIQTFAEAGGVPANYARVTAFERSAESSRIERAVLEDLLTGDHHSVAARAFVNATGPASDSLRRMANPALNPRLVLSRGVHILLPLGEEEHGMALLVPRTEDGRIIFAIPWCGRLLVGTTDEQVETEKNGFVTKREAAYLLRHLNRYLRRPRGLDEIVSTFFGVRPLVRAAHARETRKLIREHEVEVDPKSRLVSILGGKWTTYRVMAQDTIEAVARQLDRPLSASPTSELKLAGAVEAHEEFAGELAKQHGITTETAKHLAKKFGACATRILEMAREAPELLEPLVEGYPAIQAETVYSARHEMALTLEDVLARRLGLQYYSWALAAQAAPVAARRLAAELGWAMEQTDEAVKAYVAKLEAMRTALNQD